MLTVSGLGLSDAVFWNPMFSNLNGSCFISRLLKGFISIPYAPIWALYPHAICSAMEWATINSRNRGGANRRVELSPARASMLRGVMSSLPSPIRPFFTLNGICLKNGTYRPDTHSLLLFTSCLLKGWYFFSLLKTPKLKIANLRHALCLALCSE